MLHNGNYIALFSASEQTHSALAIAVCDFEWATVALHSAFWIASKVTVALHSAFWIASKVTVALHSVFWIASKATVALHSAFWIASKVTVALHSAFWIASKVTVALHSAFWIASKVTVALHSAFWIASKVTVALHSAFWIASKVTVALHSAFCLFVTWLVPRETAAVSAHVLCTPYNHAPVYSVTIRSHMRRVYVFGRITGTCYVTKELRMLWIWGTHLAESLLSAPQQTATPGPHGAWCDGVRLIKKITCDKEKWTASSLAVCAKLNKGQPRRQLNLSFGFSPEANLKSNR